MVVQNISEGREAKIRVIDTRGVATAEFVASGGWQGGLLTLKRFPADLNRAGFPKSYG